MGLTNLANYFYIIEKFKYIQNVSPEEGIILIHKRIGNDVDKYGNISYGINGADFSAEMLYLQNVCNSITVRISSEGGSVLDGYKIASSILNSTVPVTTIIEGLAASTAMWCAAAGTAGKRKAMDFSNGMIHPSTGGDDGEVLNMVNKTINTLLANRSSKTPEEMAAMMSSETWMDAQTLLSNGLIDEIVPTSIKKPKFKKTDSVSNIAKIYNSLLNTKDMSKINSLLKISNNADESEQAEAIAKLNQRIDKLNEDLQASNEKVKSLEDEKSAKEAKDKSDLENKAAALINKAEADKKIKKEESAGYLKMASASNEGFEVVSNMLSKLGSGKEAKKIFDPTNINNKADVERASWSWSEWSKKDPAGLDKIRNGNPEQYEEMYNAEFKK